LNYIEPFLTHDLDLFIALKNCQDGIVDLSPIYGRLKDMGYGKFDREGLVIEEWPVQFIIPPDGLEKEALENAEEDHCTMRRAVVDSGISHGNLL